MNVIPKKIYQSWKTKNLPEKMQKIVEKTKQMNPEYEYELWDDSDCYNFLLQNFGKNYADAFDILIPGAFKCDFWRYAVLYVNGGIYMDLDMTPEVPFSEIIRKNDQFVSIVDMKVPQRHPCAIYQAFIACRPKHPIMLTSLQLTFYNIVSRRHDIDEKYGNLGVTGPIVVGIAMNLYWDKVETHKNIEPGEYKHGIRLFQMNSAKTWDNEGKIIFDNKFSGYERGTDYARVDSYYKDDPKKRIRKIIKYILITLVSVAILGLIFTYVFRKKFKNCEKFCSQSSK